MATCPECRTVYDDGLETCPVHGRSLVPDDLLLPVEAPLAEGTMVGEYRIFNKLGSGSFGDVYAGEHPLIGKRVAVKLLNRRFASDPEMVSRFIAEARAVNKIRQRNIIDIFAFGVLHEQQRHYFVMELLDGLTLGDLLQREGRLSVAAALPIIRGIADALDAVHEAGITHRDLKPDNVFLAKERDGGYFPKLLDFGIAKLTEADSAHQTGSGVVLGTPRYISPEQARGKKADHHADIYALGVIIHEMLTGSPPFTGDDAMDVLLKHVSDPPPRMSSVNPDVPRALDVPVLAMLAKRPADRPHSAGRAVEDLIECARRLGLDRPESPSTRGTNVVRSPASADEPEVSENGPTVILAAGVPDKAAGPRASKSNDTFEPSVSPGLGTLKSPGQPAPGELATIGAAARSTDAPTSNPQSSARSAGPHAGESAAGLSPVETSSAVVRLGGSMRKSLVAAAVLVIVGVVTAFSLRRGTETPSADLTPTPTPTAHAAVIAPSSTAAPPATPEPTVTPSAAVPETIAVRLTTQPADVEVWLGDKQLGSSAAPIDVPRGEGRLELRLKKPGFKDRGLTLTPDRDQSVEATLSPLPTSPRGETKPAGAKPTSTSKSLDKLLGERD